jgi:hypothetical protein
MGIVTIDGRRRHGAGRRPSPPSWTRCQGRDR